MTWIYQTYDRSKLSTGSRCTLIVNHIFNNKITYNIIQDSIQDFDFLCKFHVVSAQLKNSNLNGGEIFYPVNDERDCQWARRLEPLELLAWQHSR